MSVLETIKKRYSVRKYSDKKFEKEKLEKIIKAAHAAPTAANLQPVRLFIAESGRTLEKISRAANIYNAPLAIVVCTDRSKSWKRNYDGKDTADIDAAILTDHMMLEAADLGLGSVWICWFNPEVLKRELNLPENLEPVNILAIGYSDAKPLSSERHDMKRTNANPLF